MSHILATTLVEWFRTSPVTADAAGSSLYLIIALPLLGAFVSGVFGKTLGRENVHLVACGSIFGSLLLSLIVFWALFDPLISMQRNFGLGEASRVVGHDFGTWFSAGDFRVNFGLVADHLSAAMLLVITGVGFLIHVYSTSYMSHDKAYWRFFAYLNLFVAMMLTLVLADSLVLLFVGWEGVGMCSYLLIGFWYDDPLKAFAGRKAFITNRIGDFGFLVGSFLMVLLMTAFFNHADKGTDPRSKEVSASLAQGLVQKGPLSFEALEKFATSVDPHPGATYLDLQANVNTGPLAHFHFTYGRWLTIILMFFLLGAAGKSAQIPLYVWLPDAMAGPTPVSALIHAATMVTSGIYLFCRISYLVVLSPSAMAAITVIGGCTALLAALIAFAQNDIKKILAYSTVSQLGFMFMGIGAGVFWAAFLHVVTHAFFKACLFLGAGSVMHGNGDETDIKKLGGLRHEMKWTWVTFMISTLAITGIVPLSGFFSKDAILHGMHTNEIVAYPHVLHFMRYVGLLTAACTAFYMTRLYWLTFEGQRAPDAKLKHAHESNFAMVMPLVVLAFLAVIFIAQGIPFMNNAGGLPFPQTVMENYQFPVFRTATIINMNSGYIHTPAEWEAPYMAWVVAWLISAAAGAAAFFMYTRIFPPHATPETKALSPLRTVAWNKFYIDEIYDSLIIRPLKLLSTLLFKLVDVLFIDTLGVRFPAWLTARAGDALRLFQTGDAQSYAAIMTFALVSVIAFAIFGASK